ncbi:hypothetical protein KJ068_24740 [bacterium]|nr:hypothetical protein [bacterium]
MRKLRTIQACNKLQFTSGLDFTKGAAKIQHNFWEIFSAVGKDEIQEMVPKVNAKILRAAALGYSARLTFLTVLEGKHAKSRQNWDLSGPHRVGQGPAFPRAGFVLLDLHRAFHCGQGIGAVNCAIRRFFTTTLMRAAFPITTYLY